ncbi:hypothetical protein HO173_011559 [Letharia columbiana]|uniref:Dipeptidyl-peptidase V n=1 Tax=Letharia columbiana TaxID=112416 RepID=A0A8H6FJ91_9LECA|nr:uncharacterized protein HO173_011559 [Letharia columbiana]KAF6229519.1 hypothetical protein HO173_011559 [Letharia columbiana]
MILYCIPVHTYTKHPASPPHKVSIPNYDGTASSPTFSPDGKSAAFLRTEEPGGDFDRPRIFLIRDTDDVEDITEITTSESWDLQPLSLTFSSDAETLHLTVEDGGRRKLFQIPVPPHLRQTIRRRRSDLGRHSITPHNLGVFITANPRTGIAHELSRHTDYSSSHFAQRYPQVSDIQFPGAGPYDVHAFVVKPSSLSADDKMQTGKKKKKKRYPLLFRIHGGPQDSFLDERSTRRNPAVFAESRLRRRPPVPDRLHGLRAGLRRRRQKRPDRDLVRCFDHVRATLDYADTDRAIATGYSYGGYTMNWIARRSRALVRHDGIFGLTTLLSSNGTGRLAPHCAGALWERTGTPRGARPGGRRRRWSFTAPGPITEGLAALRAGWGSRFLS